MRQFARIALAGLFGTGVLICVSASRSELLEPTSLRPLPEWLIGPFADAWLRVHPNDHATITDLLIGFTPHLADYAVGTIAEVFDGEPPHRPRGCTAQAWSVAEWLRIASHAPNSTD